MKNLFIITLLLCGALFMQAQSIDRQVLASTGGFVTTGSAQVSYTTGESVIQYLSSGSTSISQGFQQSNSGTSSISELNNNDVRITAFPNPFLSFIEIKCDALLNDATFRMTDAFGKAILLQSTVIESGKKWRINVDGLPAGNYWITITSEGRQSCFSLIHITN